MCLKILISYLISFNNTETTRHTSLWSAFLDPLYVQVTTEIIEKINLIYFLFTINSFAQKCVCFMHNQIAEENENCFKLSISNFQTIRTIHKLWILFIYNFIRSWQQFLGKSTVGYIHMYTINRNSFTHHRFDNSSHTT